MVSVSDVVKTLVLRALEQQAITTVAIIVTGLILYERGIRPLREGLVELRARTLALVEVTEKMLHRLVKRNILKGEDVLDFLRPLLAESVGRVVRLEEQYRNPLSPQEVERLKHYQWKLQTNQPFTAEEARDLQALTEKVKAERPGDPAVWILAFFVGLLAGALLGSQKQS